ncbi:L-Lysine-8-amino-7-oxononanoate aminotransferase [Poriferisphaera corsica]|uniref:Adenosylmethionine-8-amino-7-oxononanoate aminotransferase n=1 Tax=Poriferisphaera corsica TaxID=2528020 RepID=A0A517YX64_9BACT|nr:adenosylmethionine--8-amino-7-oxononanoate transaminase [Poriferisphaera corsica]QDU34809.1 L-Lysine-8-amino-7-oxononanoate aminotransferase [Poriferisphaera corsica]
MKNYTTDEWIALDHKHVWHPFTPMGYWREQKPLVIERGEGDFLIDTDGKRYIDGVSSLWCNVHGHQVKEIDDAVKTQLGKIAHTTLLGMASPPSIEVAKRLSEMCPGRLNKVFFSDAGATAVEVAFKMAVGYWFHQGMPEKCKFIGLAGAYHGDTTGTMSVGYSDLFHKPFISMVFPVSSFPAPDTCRPPHGFEKSMPKCYAEGHWPSEDKEHNEALSAYCLGKLEEMLKSHAGETAAIVVEPVMQGAAGMVCQPKGFLKGVEQLAKKYDVLLIADEVAVGFGRTGHLFAVDGEHVEPDILCLAKGISGGYLPLAATVVSDEIDRVFAGDDVMERRTLYHGHTYTGNPLACAAALATFDLFEKNDVINHARKSAEMIHERLRELLDHPNILDVRQRGTMVGIELCRSRDDAEPFDFSKRTAAEVCMSMREEGLIIRPLGDIIVLMPMPGMKHENLSRMLDVVVKAIKQWSFEK